jgi:hypothetical protein
MPKHTRLMCCICDGEIDIEPITGWSKGHNAYPVVEERLNDENGKYVVSHGRCCSVCNEMKVMPARIKNIVRDTEPTGHYCDVAKEICR